jgi:pyruvate,orthophosphate dikinase
MPSTSANWPPVRSRIIEANTGKPFPRTPTSNSKSRSRRVFRSWNGKRAIDYRKQFKITKEMANGTAVNVCTMVFGNMGNDSGTGVGFTRNPGTGENLIYGEYLVNAQGEDVVAGIRTPKAIAEMEQDMPEIYRQLLELHNASNRITRKCRTSNSPSSAARSTACRPATAR